MEPLVAEERWVIDGTYRSKLGDLVLRNADLVVWLDLPIRVWLPRLMRRTWRRIRRARTALERQHREPEGCATFWGRESLFVWAFRMHFDRRRRYAVQLVPYPVVRLRSPREVERWLESATK